MCSKEWNISVCGLNCAKCDLLEQKECSGCRGSLDNHWSPECQFLACIRERKINYCFECEEFPCSRIISFANDGHEHHKITVENLKSMRIKGLKQWIREQKETKFCPGWIV